MRSLLAGLFALISAAAANAQDLVVRASPTEITDEAERALAAVTEPTLMRVEAGQNPIELARASCGRLTSTYLTLLAQANEEGAFAIVDAPRYLRLPACFVVRPRQMRYALARETFEQFAHRTVGAWSPNTANAMVTQNRAAFADVTFPLRDWSQYSTRVLSEDTPIYLDFASESVVFRVREGVASDTAIRTINTALGVQRSSAPDELELESSVPAGVAARGQCPTAFQGRPWPIDHAGILRALERNRLRRDQQHLPNLNDAAIAVIDNGVDGLLSGKFPLRALALNVGERPDDRVDNDNNGYVDDYMAGVNIFTKDRPEPMGAITDPAHGTHIATLAYGGLPFLFAADANRLPVRLLMISIVRPPSPAAGLTNYSMPVEGLTQAFDYASQRDAHILNLSISTSQNLRAWIARVRQDPNTLLVVAAGNRTTDYDRNARYPAFYGGSMGEARDQVVTVAAHDENLCITPFSGHSSGYVDLAAPGVAITAHGLGATTPALDGTSQATAFVSFAAALLRAEGLGPMAIKYRLWASVDLSPGLNGVVASDGALNIVKAISRHDDVLETQAGVLRFGRLETALDLETWCPDRHEYDETRILKISRRVDRGDTNAVRLLVRWPNQNVRAIHCRPAVDTLNFRDEDDVVRPVRVSDIIDLVPRD